MTNIEELRAAIRSLHGAESTHRESVPVKETWQGQTIWEGVVEVFNLHGHPKTDTVYAWLHDTGDPDAAALPVTVLHLHPALSPVTAIRAFILQGVRNARAEA